MAVSEAPHNLSDIVVANASVVHRNLSSPVLYEHAVRRGEGKLLQGGTFAVASGDRTGRSPDDKFVVRTPEISEHVWWGKHNQPMSVDTFDRGRGRILYYFKHREPAVLALPCNHLNLLV